MGPIEQLIVFGIIGGIVYYMLPARVKKDIKENLFG